MKRREFLEEAAGAAGLTAVGGAIGFPYMSLVRPKNYTLESREKDYLKLQDGFGSGYGAHSSVIDLPRDDKLALKVEVEEINTDTRVDAAYQLLENVEKGSNPRVTSQLEEVEEQLREGSSIDVSERLDAEIRSDLEVEVETVDYNPGLADGSSYIVLTNEGGFKEFYVE